MTEHRHAFDAALATVSAILGAPSHVNHYALWSFAEWWRSGACITLDDGEAHPMLGSIDDAGDVRVHDATDDGVRAACQRLGWSCDDGAP